MSTSGWIAIGLGAVLWIPFLALVAQDWHRRRVQRKHERRMMAAIEWRQMIERREKP